MKWASWVNFILGLWLIVAPFALGYGRVVTASATEDVILGILIAAFSIWIALVAAPMAAPSWLVAIFGLWVLIAPFVLGYNGRIGSGAANDVVIGIVVLILSVARAVTAGPRASTPA